MDVVPATISRNSVHLTTSHLALENVVDCESLNALYDASACQAYRLAYFFVCFQRGKWLYVP